MKISYMLLILIIAATLTLGCQQQNSPADTQNNEQARRNTLMARAEFAALNEVVISPPFSTEVLQLAPEGTKVKAGGEIARLSPGDRFEDLRVSSQELVKQKLVLERESQLVQMNSLITDVSKSIAFLELEGKKIERDRAADGRDWQRILELGESARSESVRAKMLHKKLAAGVSMAARGFVARQEVIDNRKELDVMAINASLTARLIPFSKETPDAKNLFKAVQELEKAELKLLVASFSLARTAADYQVNFNAAQLEHSHSASSVVELENQVASLSILASSDGVVIHGQTFDGTGFSKVQTGSQVYPGIYFLSLVNPELSGINFALDQRDAALVASTSPFFFRADAYPESLVQGKLFSTIPMALEISGAKPDGRTQVAFKASVASYPEHYRLGYSGTVYIYDFVSETLSRFAGNRNYTVISKPFKRVMSTTGDVKPASATSFVSMLDEGKLNQLAEEGKSIKRGEVVAVLGSDQLTQDASDSEIDLKKKGEEYELLLQKNKIEQERLSRSIEVREGALEVARLKHASLLKSRDEDKIMELRRGLELIEAKIALGKEKISHIQELRKKGLSSEIDLMSAETELASLQKDRTISAYNLEDEESGPSGRSVKLSQLDVRKAELELEKTRLEVKMSVFRNLMEEKIQQATIRGLETTLAGYRKQLEAATIKASADGVVVHNEFHKSGGGLGKARVGDKVGRSMPFVQVADLTNLQVHTVVSEMDIKFVKPGDEVKLMLKGSSVRTFPGWVSSVGMVAATDFKKRQDAVVPVIIDLLSPAHGVKVIDPAFRPGNTCEVEFKLYDLPDATFIPFDALLPTATATCVVGPDKSLRPVEILFSDGLRGCAVKSGLAAGDSILLQESEND